MVKIIADMKTTSHAEWLRLRQNGIGGSDAGAICGYNKYSSPISVYMDKISPIPREIPDNEAMRVGRDLEEYVARRFTEATGKKVHRKNFMVQSEEYPFMYADIDRKIIGENAGLECKTANAYNADKWADGAIPDSYELQCYHYMAVNGFDGMYIACLIMGIDFQWRYIPRDEDVISSLIKIESDFWHNNVLTRNMPAPDGSKDAEEIITGLSLPQQEDSVELPAFSAKAARFVQIAELEKELKKEKEQLKQEMQQAMGHCKKAVFGNYKASNSISVRETFDTKKFKQDNPDIAVLYTKQSAPSARFTLKEIKEK